MGKIVFYVILSALFIAMDFYIHQAIKAALINSGITLRKAVMVSLWTLTGITLIVVAIGIFSERGALPKWFYNYFIGVLVMLYIAKIFTISVLFMEDLTRGIQWIYYKIVGNKEYDASRSEFMGQLALVAGGTLGATFLYGITKGAFNYSVITQKLEFPNLPKAFDGLRVVQISDLHVGSFVSERPLEKAVKMINDLEADLVLFTGDLVNDRASETAPFIDTLSKIKAKHGVYSILGNHDYGDYVKWESKETKRANLEYLIQTQRNMGWNVLVDENVKLTRGNEHISIIGIQNWGAKGNFPKYGDLKKAHTEIADSPFKILMSHDPSHWRAEVTQLFKDIDLTLSGHTHGMQFGVEIPGLVKFSPVKWFYKEWAGLYSEGTQHLYVNRGLGFIGYPGRVGISPEITVLELHRS